MWTIQYLVLTSFFFSLAALFLVHFMRKNPGSPGTGGPDDQNGNGGWEADVGLPIIDMPPGSTLDLWLTDKLNNRDVPKTRRTYVKD